VDVVFSILSHLKLLLEILDGLGVNEIIFGSDLESGLDLLDLGCLLLGVVVGVQWLLLEALDLGIVLIVALWLAVINGVDAGLDESVEVVPYLRVSFEWGSWPRCSRPRSEPYLGRIILHLSYHHLSLYTRNILQRKVIDAKHLRHPPEHHHPCYR
jgi:hypothetical protein